MIEESSQDEEMKKVSPFFKWVSQSHRAIRRIDEIKEGSVAYQQGSAPGDGFRHRAEAADGSGFMGHQSGLTVM